MSHHRIIYCSKHPCVLIFQVFKPPEKKWQFFRPVHHPSDYDLPNDAAVAGVGRGVARLQGLVEADLRLVLGVHLGAALLVVLHVGVRHATHIPVCVGRTPRSDLSE